MPKPTTSISDVSPDTPYATEPVIVSYCVLAGRNDGGRISPRSKSRCTVLDIAHLVSSGSAWRSVGSRRQSAKVHENEPRRVAREHDEQRDGGEARERHVECRPGGHIELRR